jgi:hypothetical protein
MTTKTSQLCPAWLAVFSPATRQKHTNEELIDFMHSYVNDKRPVIGRMLKGHAAYVALTGHDLHDKSVDDVNASKVRGTAESRKTFPFNEHKAKLFADMYEGAALLHSKKTVVEACLNEAVKQDGGRRYDLAKHPDFPVLIKLDDQGLKVRIADGSTWKSKSKTTEPIAQVIGENVFFRLPKNFEHDGVKLSWQELEQDFGITKALYDVAAMTDAPMMALQRAYKAIHSQEVHESYPMDFTESDEQVAPAVKVALPIQW